MSTAYFAPLAVTNRDESRKMRALEFHGKKDVRVCERARPLITQPTDAIVRTLVATVCGSDLHLYHDEFPGLAKGDVFGHEGVGIVEEVGPEVKDIKVGDRVVISAIIACGKCAYCQRQEFSLCDVTNPCPEMEALYGHHLAGVFGYSHLLGGFDGTQAEIVRIPLADNVLLKLPPTISDDLALLLSDIACTGWHGCELGEVSQGKTVAVWGCGPVGLMAQMWAKFRGASQVFAIDQEEHRLQVSKNNLGTTIININEEDVYDALKRLCPGGPDVCIDTVGFRFPHTIMHKIQRKVMAETDAPEVVAACIKCCRKGGNVSLIGDYLGMSNQFPLGMMMEKAVTVRGGQVYVQKYWKQLLQYIVEGRVNPSFVITHHLPLQKADEAYRMFDKKEDGAIKIILQNNSSTMSALQQGQQASHVQGKPLSGDVPYTTTTTTTAAAVPLANLGPVVNTKTYTATTNQTSAI